MTFKTIAILSSGEMGGNVGGALAGEGYDIVTSLAGRSEATRERATRLGFRDAGSLDDAVAAADLIFSILPPGRAVDQAKSIAAAMGRTGHTPPYIDCNAVAPATAHEIGTLIGNADAEYIDAGIIGSPPGKNPSQPTRFFVSGPGAAKMAEFDGKGISIRQCGPDLGRASAIKMCYAGITKGTSALHATLLMAAENLVSPKRSIRNLNIRLARSTSGWEIWFPPCPPSPTAILAKWRRSPKRWALLACRPAFTRARLSCTNY